MIKGIKVRLLPTAEQESQLWKSANIARWAYNWALDKQIKYFEITGKLTKIKDGELRKEITILKQTAEYRWLYEVSNNVVKQAVKDLCNAIDRFHDESKKHGYRYRDTAIKSGKILLLKDFENFPRFKTKRKSEPKFYNDTDKLKVKEDKILLEKVGWIQISEIGRIPMNVKYTNPRISFDGKYWYVSVGIEHSQSKGENTDISIGVDVGLKEMAVISNIDKPFKNINKTKEVKRLKKKLKRKQRQVSKKYEESKIQIGKVGENRYKFTKSNNIKKMEKEIKLIQRRLSNIRLNHIHQTTTKIVKTKPSRIVVEDLNIKGLMKNRHLSKAIQEQCFHKFITILEYKSNEKGIIFEKADRFYPSSKMCSCCGEIKKDLKLKDRIFKCPNCGLDIDRDKNASINLSNYKKSA